MPETIKEAAHQLYSEPEKIFIFQQGAEFMAQWYAMNQLKKEHFPILVRSPTNNYTVCADDYELEWCKNQKYSQFQQIERT